MTLWKPRSETWDFFPPVLPLGLEVEEAGVTDCIITSLFFDHLFCWGLYITVGQRSEIWSSRFWLFLSKEVAEEKRPDVVYLLKCGYLCFTCLMFLKSLGEAQVNVYE